jgi:hypothetical protein
MCLKWADCGVVCVRDCGDCGDCKRVFSAYRCPVTDPYSILLHTFCFIRFVSTQNNPSGGKGGPTGPLATPEDTTITTLWVGGVSATMTETDVRGKFGKYGETLLAYKLFTMKYADAGRVFLSVQSLRDRFH